eukprot:m51a1_g7827 hypothetical protein (452) ;mRNA; r:151867-153222
MRCTLKRKVAMTLTARGSKNWQATLKEVVEDYNNTVHSATGFTPRFVHELMAQEDAPRNPRALQLVQAIQERFAKQQWHLNAQWYDRDVLHQGNLMRMLREDKKQVQGDSVFFHKRFLQNWSTDVYLMLLVCVGRTVTESTTGRKMFNLNPITQQDRLQLMEQGPIYWIKKLENLRDRGSRPVIVYGNCLQCIPGDTVRGEQKDQIDLYWASTPKRGPIRRPKAAPAPAESVTEKVCRESRPQPMTEAERDRAIEDAGDIGLGEFLQSDEVGILLEDMRRQMDLPTEDDPRTAEDAILQEVVTVHGLVKKLHVVVLQMPDSLWGILHHMDHFVVFRAQRSGHITFWDSMPKMAEWESRRDEIVHAIMDEVDCDIEWVFTGVQTRVSESAAENCVRVNSCGIFAVMLIGFLISHEMHFDEEQFESEHSWETLLHQRKYAKNTLRDRMHQIAK